MLLLLIIHLRSPVWDWKKQSANSVLRLISDTLLLSQLLTGNARVPLYPRTVRRIRQRINDKWGAAVFVDVGAVGEQETPSFSRVSTGVGAGVRYNLGFGPIRADIAIPLNKRAGDPGYQIYLSIGQSF